MTRRHSVLLVLGILAADAAVACGTSNGATPADGGAADSSTAGDSGPALDSSHPMDSSPPGDSGAPVDSGGMDTSDGGPAPPPAVSSSGAIGVVTVNGKQKLYLPTGKTNAAGHSVVSVVDVGVAGNGTAGAPALITDIDLGTSTDTGLLSSGDSTMVLVASGTTRTIWIIDPTTDMLVKTIALDASTKKTVFSTMDGYMNGIVVDSPRRKAYIAVWNGFAVFDMNPMAITSTILANPSENFGFYYCTKSGEGTPPPTCNQSLTPDGGLIAAGLSVIDLTDGTVYMFEDPNAQYGAPNPLGFYPPDSAGVDPATQMVLIGSEGGAQYALDFSQAVFDKAKKMVTAPVLLICQTSNFGTCQATFDGVAVEPTKHFAFWEEEFSTGQITPSVGLLRLSGLTIGAGNEDAGPVPGFTTAAMPNPPAVAGYPYFETTGDPHAVAAATGIVGGKSVAFLLDYISTSATAQVYNWVARVDLETMSTLTGAKAGQLTGPELAPAVTYLDVLTKEP